MRTKYLSPKVLYEKMYKAGICGKWYAPHLVQRLIRRGVAVIPKTWSGRVRMTNEQMDSFVTAFSSGGKMRWP